MRVHEPLSVMDLLDADNGAHSWSIPAAMAAVAEAGRGVHACCCTGRRARPSCAHRAMSTTPVAPSKMDLRNYGIGAQILRDLNVGRMRLLAKPRKMPSMTGFDLEVAGYIDQPARPRAAS